MKKIQKFLSNHWFLDILVNGIVILGLVFLIRHFLIAPFDVSGSSMCPTLNNIKNQCEQESGEKIIINVAKYVFSQPERGDIVVFKAKQDLKDEKYFIKRVIGLPGESIKFEDGNVLLKQLDKNEFIQIEEPYLDESNRGKTKIHFSDFNEFNIPPGKYFLMGDNRKASTDSRTCFRNVISADCINNHPDAFVPEAEIIGKTMLVWWPLNNIRLVKNPLLYVELMKSESLEEK